MADISGRLGPSGITFFLQPFFSTNQSGGNFSNMNKTYDSCSTPICKGCYYRNHAHETWILWSVHFLCVAVCVSEGCYCSCIPVARWGEVSVLCGLKIKLWQSDQCVVYKKMRPHGNILSAVFDWSNIDICIVLMWKLNIHRLIN